MHVLRRTGYKVEGGVLVIPMIAAHEAKKFDLGVYPNVPHSFLIAGPIQHAH